MSPLDKMFYWEKSPQYPIALPWLIAKVIIIKLKKKIEFFQNDLKGMIELKMFLPKFEEEEITGLTLK